VNFTLVPEIPFRLEVFLEALAERLQARRHAVIVVAEGAGQDLFGTAHHQRDASGNVRYHDIGPFLRDQIREYFARRDIPLDLKYIDPSYVIRSVPANCHDSLLCDQLARRAVHAGMAGKTDVLIGFYHFTYIQVPIPMAIGAKKQVDPRGVLWRSVRAATGQPRAFV
jgi:6-phosphofructokinase 1